MQKNTAGICMTIAFALLSTLFPQGLSAQGIPMGFSMFNQRNHPELKWQSAETDHFMIHWPAHLDGIEAQAAAIAEATYEALSENLKVSFDYKIRIYLSDEDEIINGFAVPFPRSYTNIWVNLNQVAEAWSGPEKWLRTVLAHELAHIFHFEAIRSNIPLVGILGIAPALPEPWTEGIAQYQTEPWHALRGDDLLRKAFYDGRPSFRDKSSLRNPALMYASGNSQLRYFASTYGDSLLADILSHRQEKLGGLIRYHSFNKAFEEVMDKPFDDFEEAWMRHMNIYYHSLAGQMERSDSLGVKPEDIPGLFVGDVQYNADTSALAVIALISADQPYQQLAVISNDSIRKRRVLAEGSFLSPLSWSPDGKTIAYAALSRGANGSLLNDLYLIDVATARRQRLTHSRRASFPAYSPDGQGLYFVVNEGGTGNVFFMRPEDGQEERVTSYEGDVQLGRLAIHPEGTHLAYARFEADGNRHLVVYELLTGNERIYGEGKYDDRMPLWNTDGTLLAYTSLRDHVPNLFVIDPFSDETKEERITALFTGATAIQWLPADSLHAAGSLLVTSSDTKRNNRIYRIDASRRVSEPDISLNPSYTRWLHHQPPKVIPSQIAADPGLIRHRSSYRSFRNISHITSLPIPYYTNSEEYGLGMLALFSEPLSKHMINLAASVSFTNPRDNSLLFLSYTNNQFRPSISLNFYHNSFTGRFYERDYLVTTNSGVFLMASLPRDWFDNQFISTRLYTRIRSEYTDATRFWEEGSSDQSLGTPDSGRQDDLRLGMRISKQKPYAHQMIHPLSGWGVEARISMATDAMGGETSYVRPDLTSYIILPGLGNQRFYLYGRAVAQWGEAFAQDYIGLSRYDDIQFGGTLAGLDFLYTDTERIRGYREYVTGNRLLFGSVEYRIPFADDLNTSLLGLISLGRTTLTAFADGGLVWSDDMSPGSEAVRRAGAGLELKNVLNIAGINIVHSLGVARPTPQLSNNEHTEWYYRIRAVVPF
jgi:hypothetical protein